jgi:hypothetical protein
MGRYLKFLKENTTIQEAVDMTEFRNMNKLSQVHITETALSKISNVHYVDLVKDIFVIYVDNNKDNDKINKVLDSFGLDKKFYKITLDECLTEDEKKADPAKVAEASKKQHEKMIVLQQQLSDAKTALNKARSALKQGEKSSTATLNAQDRIELINNKIRILQRRS